MSRLSRVSEISEESFSSSGSSRAPNFSRPHPQSTDSYEPGESLVVHDRPSIVRVISAFHEPNRDLPDEPRFSLDSQRTQTTTSDNSAGSEFARDGKTGELVSRTRRKQFDEQRYLKESRARPDTFRTAKSENSMAASANTGPPASSSQIFKRVSVDVQSERLSMTTNDQYEDTSSHHTISDDEDSGSFDREGEWRSSDYDTTGLSDAKIRKLLRKGVNPSLYAEMQAAKKKSKGKWIGPLVGNSFIG